MKKLSVILILLVSIGFGQVMIPDTSKMTNTEKMMWYQNEKKSPALAVFFIQYSHQQDMLMLVIGKED